MTVVTRLGPYGFSVPALANSVYAPTTTDTSAGVTGTTVASATEAEIVAGGQTTIITLTNDTWLAAGTAAIGSIVNTQAIIDGVTSAQAEGTGWNAEVRDKEVVGAVVRDSDTQATITWTAAAAYDITAIETITVTVPAEAVTAAGAIVATPTFTVNPPSTGIEDIRRGTAFVTKGVVFITDFIRTIIRRY